MLGFIKKDLFIIKNNLKSLAVVLIVFIFLAFQNMSNLSFIIPLMVIMMFISTFSYDEFNKWDAYAVTIPKGRELVVKSKYVATISLIIVSTIVVTIISILAGGVNDTSADTIISTMLGSAFAVVLVASIMYPLIFKYGVEKGRIMIFALVFGISILFGFLLKGVSDSSMQFITNFLEQTLVFIIPISMILMLGISYFMSKKIYAKKEF